MMTPADFDEADKAAAEDKDDREDGSAAQALPDLRAAGRRPVTTVDLDIDPVGWVRLARQVTAQAGRPEAGRVAAVIHCIVTRRCATTSSWC